MSVESRSAYMAKMEGSRFAPYRDLLLLAKLLAMIGWARDERVRTAIGFEYSCAVAEGAPDRPPTPLAAFGPRGEARTGAIPGAAQAAAGARAPRRSPRPGLVCWCLGPG